MGKNESEEKNEYSKDMFFMNFKIALNLWFLFTQFLNFLLVLEKMADPAVLKQIKIRTGVVKRLVKVGFWKEPNMET